MLNHEVARQCEQRLGLGEFPLVRRRLFSRLQRVCQQRGDEPLLIVSQVLEEARCLKDRRTGGEATKDSKGRYFCKAVVARLSEAGYWDKPGSTGPNEPPPLKPSPPPALPPMNETQDMARARLQREQLAAAKESVVKSARESVVDPKDEQLARLKLSNELLKRDLEATKRS
jgi:hypothetical protein